MSDYNKAIEINPKVCRGLYNRGSAYAKQGNFTQAMSDYNKAIEINPQYMVAYNKSGLFLIIS